MSAATISINSKLPNGDLVQLGGVGFDDFYANVLGAAQGDVAAAEVILDKVRTAVGLSTDGQAVQVLQQNLSAQHIPAGHYVTSDVPSPQEAVAQTQQRQAAGPPPGLTAPYCQHGQRVYQAGTSKANKPYKMWKCTSGDRANECPAEWIR
jgi:hypothetical protein